MRIRLPLNRWTLTGMVVAICSLLLWEQIALFKLARACEVFLWICWIPGVATGGVMLASTALHMTPELDERIRTYAGRLAAGGITGGILGTGVQEYIHAAHLDPSPWLALPVGGIPVLQGGLLVHLLSMVFAQVRRDRVAAEQAAEQRRADTEAAANAERERQRRVAEDDVRHRRELTRQRELADAARQAADEKARLATEATRLVAETERRAEVAREVLAKPHLVVDNTRKARQATSASVGERAQSWLRDQHAAGVPLDSDDPRVGPAAIARAIGANPETCRKSHRRWKANVVEELRVLAELREAAG